ncbi:MAG: hypothetical protein IKV94_04310 [Clostridia bacterium]|nr:hypothetical protein [Clostridia bacterium]
MTRCEPSIYLLEFSEEVSEITVYNKFNIVVSDNRDYVKLEENDVIKIAYTNGTNCSLRLTKDSRGFYNLSYIV